MFDLKRLILISLTIILLVTPNIVLATDTDGEQFTVNVISTRIATPTPIDYPLPVPGMMTDHPAYFLKNFRDMLLEFFIRDPVKKIEFDILQEDKFLNMAIELSHQGKWVSLAEPLDQSYRYSLKAQKRILKIKTDNGEYPGHLKENLVKSINKHIEVMNEIRQKAPEIQKNYCTADIDRYTVLLVEIKKM